MLELGTYFAFERGNHFCVRCGLLQTSCHSPDRGSSAAFPTIAHPLKSADSGNPPRGLQMRNDAKVTLEQ